MCYFLLLRFWLVWPWLRPARRLLFTVITIRLHTLGHPVEGMPEAIPMGEGTTRHRLQQFNHRASEFLDRTKLPQFSNQPQFTNRPDLVPVAMQVTRPDLVPLCPVAMEVTRLDSDPVVMLVSRMHLHLLCPVAAMEVSWVDSEPVDLDPQCPVEPVKSSTVSNQPSASIPPRDCLTSESFSPTAPQQTVVQKHIYVHVPPQEPEEVRQQQLLSPAVARKHYKIIFIKTPNVQPSAAQIALQQSQSEEKTIVYVLVKKPEDQGDISIPQLPSLPPSKPEVYFIKYKANRGASNGAVSSFGGASGAVSSFGGGGASFDAAGAFSGAVSGASSATSGGHHVGFDSSLGSGASSSASTQVSGSK